MDNEFETLNDKMLDNLEVITPAKGEHVGKIECKIRQVKNRARSMRASLPYKALPNCMIKAMLSNVVMWMKALVSPQGDSREHSPRELILCRQMDITLHAKYPFGS